MVCRRRRSSLAAIVAMSVFFFGRKLQGDFVVPGQCVHH
jgi:hypothetical protein